MTFGVPRSKLTTEADKPQLNFSRTAPRETHSRRLLSIITSGKLWSLPQIRRYAEISRVVLLRVRGEVVPAELVRSRLICKPDACGETPLARD
ncbi:hypothetical protein EVAR_28407_1 [Eumeta japonica]|uniref:Uncharacterized protein n=1 Tax=Eumeta variegata TaxID=151549 RepID=A0A4C1V969_EUMVA|nr:hypothetical protein EVAR_28407_1 [Eumeta japonica]